MRNEMALNGGKTLKLLSGKEDRQGYVQAYLLTKKICSNFFLTLVKNAMHVLQVPLQVFIFSECPCFSPKFLIVWKTFFSSFSLDCKQEIEW